MNRLLIMSWLLVAASLLNAADALDPRWSPVSLEVRRPSLGRDLTIEPGTRLIADLTLPNHYILGLRPKESRVDRFTDDKSTDLLQLPDRIRFMEGGIGSQFEVSADGKHCSVPFEAPVWPTPGSTKVRVKGSVAVLVGKDEKEIERKNVSVRTGVELGIGTLKPKELPDAKPLEHITFVTYRGDKPLKSLVFRDKDGKEIKTSAIGLGEQHRSALLLTLPEQPRTDKAQDGKVEYVAYFGLLGSIDRCSIRAVYFEKIDKIIVPVDLETGIGLP